MFQAVKINALDLCEISNLQCAVKLKQVCVARVITAPMIHLHVYVHRVCVLNLRKNSEHPHLYKYP